MMRQGGENNKRRIGIYNILVIWSIDLRPPAKDDTKAS